EFFLRGLPFLRCSTHWRGSLTTLQFVLSCVMSRFEGCAVAEQWGVDRPAWPAVEAAWRTRLFGMATVSPDERPVNVLRGHSADAAPKVRCSVPSNSLKGLERATGIEPATRSLGSYCSTTELHPLSRPYRTVSGYPARMWWCVKGAYHVRQKFTS